MEIYYKDFLQHKKQALSKLDKSNTGSIDKKVLKLCNIINNIEYLYTTSSCSGRICIVSKNTTEKEMNYWEYITHNISNPKDILNSLINLSKKKNT